MAEVKQISELRKVRQKELLTRRNVVGVGVGFKETGGKKTSDLSLSVLVRDKLAAQELGPKDLVPSTVDGIPTDVIRVGKVVAYRSHQGRFRPVPGGVSIGHFAITAGTFGAPVKDAASGDVLLLSNNHVLANSNNASIGDAIIQPGGADGGRAPQDRIADLLRFVPISYKSDDGGGDDNQCPIASFFSSLLNALARLTGSQTRLKPVTMQAVANYVDAAVAKPLNTSLIVDEIYKIGQVTGTAEASIGMAVKKSGRTTGLTQGNVTVVDTTIEVGYGGGRVASFENQILTNDMSNPGDSGSLLVSEGNQAVGLLFAGSDSVTVYNPIEAVLSALAITI